MLRRRPAPRQLPTRVVRRAPDGSLSDVGTGSTVTIAELRDDLQAGRYFQAVRSDTGLSCTNEVLAELIQSAVPDDASASVLADHPLLRLLGGATPPDPIEGARDVRTSSPAHKRGVDDRS